MIRLDAIGFLWKQIGTTCMHLPQTHAVVKLMRDVVDEVAPGTVLLTETNVPHAENVSYFGEGDEAHAVYQFSLPPLLLDAFLSGDAGALNTWLRDLEYPAGAMTYFNFTASHDGIGVRPLEGLVPPERISALADRVRQLGGRVNMRSKPDGSESPYELKHHLCFRPEHAGRTAGGRARPEVSRLTRRHAGAARHAGHLLSQSGRH